jgi:hypothetical protein
MSSPSMVSASAAPSSVSSPGPQGGKVPPVAAMREVVMASTGYGSKQRIVVGCTLLVLGGGALGYGLFGPPSNPLLIVGAAVLPEALAVQEWVVARLEPVQDRLAHDRVGNNGHQSAGEWLEVSGAWGTV